MIAGVLAGRIPSRCKRLWRLPIARWGPEAALCYLSLLTPIFSLFDLILLMDRKILFDCSRDFIAALGQLQEFGCKFFVVARLGQPAKFIRLLTQIGCPLSHRDYAAQKWTRSLHLNG